MTHYQAHLKCIEYPIPLLSPWSYTPLPASYHSHTISCSTPAGDAYSERLKTDQMVHLICLQALGRSKSGGKLEQQLQAVTDRMVIPEMPKTAAVLQSIAASGDHPGAIYRLAGDRCAPCSTRKQREQG